MLHFRKALGVALTAGLLAACGPSSQTATVASSTARGTLEVNPPLRIASLDAAGFATELGATSAGAQLLAAAGSPACGVDFYYLEFWTVGGAGEVTESSGALMVPTGAAPTCSGPRPIVLYAHGTTTDKEYNIADITNTANTEGALVAAVFAAQGYIVVAPNYAGYDISTLGYHPYLNAEQQSGEMLDSLAAARAALPKTYASATTDSGKLFVTGYSQGGHVALATLRALQAAGSAVTAAAPMSGPYALEAFGDAIFFGDVDIGSTEFTPLLSTSYQHAYPSNPIYTTTADVFSAPYATGIDTLLPSVTPIATIFANGQLPELAEFNSTTPVVSIPGQPVESAELTAALAVPANPVFKLGFGSPGLILNSYRVNYAEDALSNPDGAVPTPKAGVPLAASPPSINNLRLAFYKNDLRNGNWYPKAPTLLCGGDQDPTVFFSVNTGTMEAFWSNLPPGLITVLDVNAAPSGPFAAIQTAFQASQAEELASEGATAVVENYHTSVAPFCTVAARSFFSQF
jgi:pimeloyl-ACP methyl ester carboxylesterase